MTLHTTKWDIQDSLTTPEDCALYLQAALEDAGDDPAFITVVLGDIARSRGMSQTARDTGLSREGLRKALSADGDPRLSTLLKLLGVLGLRLHVEPQALPTA